MDSQEVTESEYLVHRLISLLVLSVLPLALLAFWACSLPSFQPEREFTLILPSTPSTIVPDTPDTPRILIAASGNVSIIGVSYDAASNQELLSLRAYLRSRAQSPKGLTGVIVWPDPSANYQRIIDVLSAIHDEHVPLYTFM